MSTPPALRTETDAGVRSLVPCRPDAYNTITPALRDELARALDEADADPAVRVILLRAEGPAFCAGYSLDWATTLQAAEEGSGRAWEPVADLAYMKLWYAPKPTIAAVQGWCIGGGTDMVLCADIVVAGQGATFGYPPSRVWGTPTTAMWVYRIGFERAKRYLLTGDEIPAPEAARIGLILEAVPDGELQEHAMALARRMARLPANQLIMLKLLCNQPAENMGLASSRTLGTLFGGGGRGGRRGGVDVLRRPGGAHGPRRPGDVIGRVAVPVDVAAAKNELAPGKAQVDFHVVERDVSESAIPRPARHAAADLVVGCDPPVPHA